LGEEHAMKKTMQVVAAVVTVVGALAYFLVPRPVEAQSAGGVSVYAEGSNGLPAKVGADGKRLKTSSAEKPAAGGDQCQAVTLPANGAADGGVYSLTLVADQHYVLEVRADGSRDWIGCWSYSRIVKPTDAGDPCFAIPGIKDGQQSFEAFREPVDAGAGNGDVVVYWYATSAGTKVKLCPKTAAP